MAKNEKKKGGLVPRGYARPLSTMRDFDRIFDEFRSGFENMFFGPVDFGKPFRGLMPVPESVREPVMDLADLGDKFELTAEMPGIPRDKINISVSDNGIEINAEVEEKKEEKGKEYVHKERSYRSFYRKMSLPSEVVSDKADAKITDGVLKIILPKKEPTKAPKAKKLEVK